MAGLHEIATRTAKCGHHGGRRLLGAIAARRLRCSWDAGLTPALLLLRQALDLLDEFEEHLHERLDLFVMALLELNQSLAVTHALSAQTHLAPSLFD